MSLINPVRFGLYSVLLTQAIDIKNPAKLIIKNPVILFDEIVPFGLRNVLLIIFTILES